MSGLCAVYSWNALPCDQSLLTRMSASLSKRGDVTGMWSEGPVGLIQAEWQEKGITSLPFCRQDGACWVAADVRFDNHQTLCSLLQDDEASQSDSSLIAAAYGRWGERCVHQLQGDYAFALWDAQKHCLFAARSPMGLRPFVYHVSRQRILCASEAKQLLEDPLISKELNTTWVALWLTQWVNHWNGTIYRDIQELLPGHFLVVNEQGIRTEQFWKPSPRTPLRYRCQEDYTEHFRQILFDAVSCRLPSAKPFLCDVSGGLDSSSIACIVGELGQQEGIVYPMHGLHAYSSTLLEQDDRTYAQFVAAKYPLQMHYLSYENHPAFDGVFRPRPWVDTPTFPTLFLADLYQHYWQIAKEWGIRRHLRGDFGDQLFSATARYITMYLDEHHYGAFLHEVARWKHIHGTSFAELLYRSVLKRYFHRCKECTEQKPAPWLRSCVWEAQAQQQEQDDEYFRVQCPDPLARILFQYMRNHSEYTTMQSDGIVAAGIETCEPYTDMRLIEFLFACPPQYQLRFGMRKFLLRDTMKGILPDPIQMRQSKGRFARIYFQGIARHHEALRELVLSLPDIIAPYIDAVPLAKMIDRIALGDTVDQSTFFSALSLIVWAHRLPWVHGKLPTCE